MVKKELHYSLYLISGGFSKYFQCHTSMRRRLSFQSHKNALFRECQPLLLPSFFAFSLYFSVTCKRQEDILALITMPNSCLSLYLILKREIFSSLITFQDTILSWQASSGILFYVSVSRKDNFQEIVSPFIHVSYAPKNVAHHRQKKSLKNPQKAVK